MPMVPRSTSTVTNPHKMVTRKLCTAFCRFRPLGNDHLVNIDVGASGPGLWPDSELILVEFPVKLDDL